MRLATPLGILLTLIPATLFASDITLFLDYAVVDDPPCQEIFLPTRNIDYPPEMVIGPTDTVYFPNSNFIVYPGQCAYDTMSEACHLNRIFIPGGYKGSEYWALYSSLPDGRIKNENLMLSCSQDGIHYDTALCSIPIYTYQDFMADYLSDPCLYFDSVNWCLCLGFRASKLYYGPGIDSTYMYLAIDTSSTDTLKFAASLIFQSDCDILSPSIVESKFFAVWPDSGYNMLMHFISERGLQYGSRCLMVDGNRLSPPVSDTIGQEWDSLIPWHSVVRQTEGFILALVVFRCYYGTFSDFLYAKEYLFMSSDGGYTWDVAPPAVHSASNLPGCFDSSGVYRADFISAWGEEALTLSCFLNGIRGLKWGANCSEIMIPVYLPGDPNEDGMADMGDAVFMVNYIFMSGSIPKFVSSMDVNGDCDVNVGDAVYMIVYMFKGGDPPQVGCATSPMPREK